MSLDNAVFALLGGGIPIIFWLWFWLKEDKKKPEPMFMLIASFVAGAISVIPSIFAEAAIKNLYNSYLSALSFFSALLLLSYAIVEELFKFVFVYFVALRQKYNDEPIDSMIYLITGALGFSALENTLFLLNPGYVSSMYDLLLTGNLRFVGATLLHTVASASIGVAMAFAFHKTRRQKFAYFVVGFIVAVLLHFIFNYSLSVLDASILKVFAFVWVLAIVLLLLFEKVKKIKS